MSYPPGSSCSLFFFTPPNSPGGHAGLLPRNEEISAPPPRGLLIGIYLLCKNWSTETFRKRELKKWDVCSSYKSSLKDNLAS